MTPNTNNNNTRGEIAWGALVVLLTALAIGAIVSAYILQISYNTITPLINNNKTNMTLNNTTISKIYEVSNKTAGLLNEALDYYEKQVEKIGNILNDLEQ